MIKFKDKSEETVLPAIPNELAIKCKELLSTLQSKNKRAILKLKDIYKYLEDYGDFVKTFSVCSKGCSHCCKIDVTITELEAKLIEEETHRKRKPRQLIASTGHTSPCPFLGDGGECTIYEVRPFHCRTFHTLDDPKYCETGEDHKIYGSFNGIYTVTIYEKLNQMRQHLNGKGAIMDIRDFFN